jgi:ribonuclease BN (tRNA processing enzyme)
MIDSNKVCIYELDSERSNIATFSGISFDVVKVSHGMDTYGLIAHENNMQLFYSADTAYFDGLDSIIRESNVVLLDSTQFDLPLSGHMTYKEVEKIAAYYPSITFYPVHRKKYDVFDNRNIRIVTDSQHKEILI